MSEEFKTIETQEALDAIIKERLERNTRSVTDKNGLSGNTEYFFCI